PGMAGSPAPSTVASAKPDDVCESEDPELVHAPVTSRAMPISPAKIARMRLFMLYSSPVPSRARLSSNMVSPDSHYPGYGQADTCASHPRPSVETGPWCALHPDCALAGLRRAAIPDAVVVQAPGMAR